MLVVTVIVVLLVARVIQFGQRVLLKKLPTGATSDLHLADVCLGILLTGVCVCLVTSVLSTSPVW